MRWPAAVCGDVASVTKSSGAMGGGTMKRHDGRLGLGHRNDDRPCGDCGSYLAAAAAMREREGARGLGRMGITTRGFGGIYRFEKYLQNIPDSPIGSTKSLRQDRIGVAKWLEPERHQRGVAEQGDDTSAVSRK
ncbi:hypothetical protein E2562_017452, partial [Oryza meyeriana var. granulata]